MRLLDDECYMNSTISLHCYGRPKHEGFPTDVRRRKKTSDETEARILNLLQEDPIYENTRKRKFEESIAPPSVSDLEIKLCEEKGGPRLFGRTKKFHKKVFNDPGSFLEFRAIKRRRIWNEKLDTLRQDLERFGTIRPEPDESDVVDPSMATTKKKKQRRALLEKIKKVSSTSRLDSTFIREKIEDGDEATTLKSIKKALIWEDFKRSSGYVGKIPSVKIPEFMNRTLNETGEDGVREARVNSLYVESFPEQWLKLAAYLATKTLYAICACDLFPVELRKKLFLSLHLVENREKNKRNGEYDQIISLPTPKMGYDQFGCLDLLESKTLVKVGPGEGVDFLHNTFGVSVSKARPYYVPCNYEPEMFKPAFSRNGGKAYLKFVRKCRDFQTREGLGTWGKPTSENDEDGANPEEENESISCKKKRRRLKRHEKSLHEDHYFPPGHWVWQDDVAFGSDEHKREIIMKLVIEESSGSVEETQRYFCSFMEYVYHMQPYVPVEPSGSVADSQTKQTTSSSSSSSSSSTAGKYSKSSSYLGMVQTALPYIVHSRSYSQSLFAKSAASTNRNASLSSFSAFHKSLLSKPKHERSMSFLFGRLREENEGSSGKRRVGRPPNSKRTAGGGPFSVAPKLRPDLRRYDGSILLLFDDGYQHEMTKTWTKLLNEMSGGKGNKGNTRTRPGPGLANKEISSPLLRSIVGPGSFERHQYYKYCMGKLFPQIHFNFYREIHRVRKIETKNDRTRKEQSRDGPSDPSRDQTSALDPLETPSARIEKEAELGPIEASPPEDDIEAQKKKNLILAEQALVGVKGLLKLTPEERRILVEEIAGLIKLEILYKFHPVKEDQRGANLPVHTECMNGKQYLWISRFVV